MLLATLCISLVALVALLSLSTLGFLALIAICFVVVCVIIPAGLSIAFIVLCVLTPLCIGLAFFGTGAFALSLFLCIIVLFLSSLLATIVAVLAGIVTICSFGSICGVLVIIIVFIFVLVGLPFLVCALTILVPLFGVILLDVIYMLYKRRLIIPGPFLNILGQALGVGFNIVEPVISVISGITGIVPKSLEEPVTLLIDKLASIESGIIKKLKPKDMVNTSSNMVKTAPSSSIPPPLLLGGLGLGAVILGIMKSSKTS